MYDEPIAKHAPGLAEDALNLSIVGASAAVAALLSLALAGAALTATPPSPDVRRIQVRVVEPPSPVRTLVVVSDGAGARRVHVTGAGRLRWDDFAELRRAR